MSAITDLIGGAIAPIANIIDSLHTSREEKDAAKVKLFEAQSAILSEVLGLEKQVVTAKQAIIVAEAKSDSFLARNWRPITMLVFVFIIANNHILAPYFGVPTLEIPKDMWDLIKIGLGGYVVSRGAEKIIKMRNGN